MSHYDQVAPDNLTTAQQAVAHTIAIGPSIARLTPSPNRLLRRAARR